MGFSIFKPTENFINSKIDTVSGKFQYKVMLKFWDKLESYNIFIVKDIFLDTYLLYF